MAPEWRDPFCCRGPFISVLDGSCSLSVQLDKIFFRLSEIEELTFSILLVVWTKVGFMSFRVLGGCVRCLQSQTKMWVCCNLFFIFNFRYLIIFISTTAIDLCTNSGLWWNSGLWLFVKKCLNAAYGGAAFCSNAPEIWNEFPENCTTAETLSSFKSRLKNPAV